MAQLSTDPITGATIAEATVSDPFTEEDLIKYIQSKATKKIYKSLNEIPAYAKQIITALYNDNLLSNFLTEGFKLPKDIMEVYVICARFGLFGEKYKTL